MQNKQTFLEGFVCLVTHFDLTQNPSVLHHTLGERRVTPVAWCHWHTRTQRRGANLTPQCTSRLNKGSKHWSQHNPTVIFYCQSSLKRCFSNWKIKAGFVLLTINRWLAEWVLPAFRTAGEVFISSVSKRIMSTTKKQKTNSYVILVDGCVR